MDQRTTVDVPSVLTRRSFLGRTITFSVVACSACAAGVGPAWGQGKREIKFSHGTGLCNMPLFYAAEKKLFAKYAIESNVVLSGWAGDQAIQLATGKVEMGVIPYQRDRGVHAVAVIRRGRR